MKQKIISTFWIITSLLLGAWCAYGMYESYQYFQFISGGIKASFVGLVYAFFTLAGGVGLMKSKSWGRLLLNISISISIFYGIIFIIFHGYIDRPHIYSFFVAVIFIASVLSLIYINSKEVKTECISRKHITSH